MNLRPVVHRGRDRLARGLESAHAAHRSGTPGRQISQRVAELYDDIVLEVWQSATATVADDRRMRGLSLVAHGGFGRRDLSPYSDVDLMLLTDRVGEPLARDIIGELTRDLGDIGLDPGLSIRRPAEATRLAWSDAVVLTSLTESRWVAGSVHVYEDYFHRLRRGAIRRRGRLVGEIVAARREERAKWGENAYMLSPNVKRSRGALRDIQLVRWLGFVSHGETDLDRLVGLGMMTRVDHRLLARAYHFLLRLRHELHFRAGRGDDVLDRHVQPAIAEEWGYQAEEGLSPVETFMRAYFDHARDVRTVSSTVVDTAAHWPLHRRMAEAARGRHLGDGVMIGPTRIWIREGDDIRVAGTAAGALRFLAAAGRHNRRIAPPTWRRIRQRLASIETLEVDEETAEAFGELLGVPHRLAALLRRLNEVRMLGKLIPGFATIRGMLQFNAYHKYTVDAHSIRAVEVATRFGRGEDADVGTGPLAGTARRYRRIADKRLLHLTLLIHDIGKGRVEDHCVVGERIAREVAATLRLDEADGDLMAWLVRNHLLVNNVAFRHDLNDPRIVLDFAKRVGSIRRLEWLVVHAVADLTAVGPGVATDWKLSLIEDLYRRTRNYFDNGDLPGSLPDAEIERKRRALIEAVAAGGVVDEDAARRVDEVPATLLSRRPVGALADVLEPLATADDDATTCVVRPDPATGGFHVTIVRREPADAVGTFAEAAGLMASLGLPILRADIERVGDLAWKDFWVSDPDTARAVENGRAAETGRAANEDEPVDASEIRRRADAIAHRTDAIVRRVTGVMDDPERPVPGPRRVWGGGADRDADRRAVEVMPVEVTWDNDTIDDYTILSLFAYDSPGLLHRVATAIADADLVLHFAKIDTHFDQVADVFYVTEVGGGQVVDRRRREAVERAIGSSVGLHP